MTMLTESMIQSAGWPDPAKPRAPAKRRAAEMMGRGAEDAVARRLEGLGFTVLARRLRTGAGEIDLVVADAGRLVFVEVKARGCLAAAALCRLGPAAAAAAGGGECGAGHA